MEQEPQNKVKYLNEEGDTGKSESVLEFKKLPALVDELLQKAS